VSPNSSPFFLSTQMAGLDEHEMQMDDEMDSLKYTLSHVGAGRPCTALSAVSCALREYKLNVYDSGYRYPIDPHTHLPKFRRQCSLNGGQAWAKLERSWKVRYLPRALKIHTLQSNRLYHRVAQRPAGNTVLILYPRSKSQNLPRVNFI